MNLPSLDRRRLLIGLAAASTAATVAALPALAAIPNAAPAENPELIRLGDLLPAVEAAFLDAERGYSEVVETWTKRWPLAPEAIVKPYADSGSWERGLIGYAIQADGTIKLSGKCPAPRSLYNSKDLERDLARLDGDMRRKRPKHPLTVADLMEMEAERAMLVDQLAAARKYEAATAQVLKASGIAEARERQTEGRKALAKLVGAIMAQPDLTMVGVIIKAQALAAWGNNPMRIFHFDGNKWPQQLAQSVLRIAGEYQHA